MNEDVAIATAAYERALRSSEEEIVGLRKHSKELEQRVGHLEHQRALVSQERADLRVVAGKVLTAVQAAEQLAVQLNARIPARQQAADAAAAAKAALTDLLNRWGAS